MKKLQETIQTLSELEQLISMMNQEIDSLRNIVYRYHLMHGVEIMNGVVDIPDNFSFHMRIDEDKNLQCIVVDCNKLNISNNYKRIQKLINPLK